MAVGVLVVADSLRWICFTSVLSTTEVFFFLSPCVMNTYTLITILFLMIWTIIYPDLVSDLHCPGQTHQPISLLDLLAHFLRHNQQRSHRIADKQNEEQHAQHKHLPRGVLHVAELVQRIRIVCLENVAGEQERQQKTESTPHPRVETLNGDVHVVPFAKSLQTIQHAFLVAELQVLHHTDVRVEVHELQTEQLPGFAFGPNEEDTGAHG